MFRLYAIDTNYFKRSFVNYALYQQNMKEATESPNYRIPTKDLDQAYDMLLDLIHMLAEKKGLPDNELRALVKELEDSYLELRFEIFANNYLSKASSYLENALGAALNRDKSEPQTLDYTNIFYHKSRTQLTEIV